MMEVYIILEIYIGRFGSLFTIPWPVEYHVNADLSQLKYEQMLLVILLPI